MVVQIGKGYSGKNWTTVARQACDSVEKEIDFLSSVFKGDICKRVEIPPEMYSTLFDSVTLCQLLGKATITVNQESVQTTKTDPTNHSSNNTATVSSSPSSTASDLSTEAKQAKTKKPKQKPTLTEPIRMTVVQVRDLLKQVGENMSEEDIDEAIRQADISMKDGKIDMEQFISSYFFTPF